jgi:hypothetical protein
MQSDRNVACQPTQGNGAGAAADAAELSGAPAETRARPYEAPRLRKLGSARQLTLISPTGSLGDGNGRKKG